MTRKIRLKHYTRRELAAIYGVCDKTFSKWLEPFLSAIGPKMGKFYKTNQVRIIFEKLELPSNYEIEFAENRVYENGKATGTDKGVLL